MVEDGMRNDVVDAPLVGLGTVISPRHAGLEKGFEIDPKIRDGATKVINMGCRVEFFA